MNARETALKILNAVYLEDAYANVALAKEFRRVQPAEQDRRFITELVYGTVKAGETLDWMIRQYSSRPVSKIAPVLQNVLRMGMFQLFYMTRVPASAACNEAVELAKKYGHAGSVKFVNAILRTAVREPDRAVFPEGKGQATKHLALSGQHPEWLIKRWIKEFGYEGAVKLCAFNNNQAILSLRTNTLKIDRETLLQRLRESQVSAEISRWTPEGILCEQHGALDSLSVLQEGFCQVQDESSMLVAHVLAPEPGEFIIDCCSAPGGKTTHIAALMNNQGHLLAGDIYEHKLEKIRENARRLGISIIEAKLMDALEIGTLYPQKADRVLVDAPCSGLGVLRRKPDARWRNKQEALQALPALQGAILKSASAAVKPGGVLVYSTCTITREENQAVVEKFLQENPAFVLDNTGAFLPGEKRTEQMVQLLPQIDGTDGFFIARMKRK